MVKLTGVCGRVFEAETIDEELVKYPEYVCSRLCGKEACMTFAYYTYDATHHNDPR